jgi:hypothetical protein
MPSTDDFKPGNKDLTEREVLNQMRDDFRLHTILTGMPTTKIIQQFDDVNGWYREKTITYGAGGEVADVSLWTAWKKI